VVQTKGDGLAIAGVLNNDPELPVGLGKGMGANSNL
jgi:hypothetical protein